MALAMALIVAPSRGASSGPSRTTGNGASNGLLAGPSRGSGNRCACRIGRWGQSVAKICRVTLLKASVDELRKHLRGERARQVRAERARQTFGKD